jgi:hypothetical protein
MSGVKRMIEDVAEDVGKLMVDGKFNYDAALIHTLIGRKIIESANDVDTIKMWDDNISHIVG